MGGQMETYCNTCGPKQVTMTVSQTNMKIQKAHHFAERHTCIFMVY